jgi:hypothetical protein
MFQASHPQADATNNAQQPNDAARPIPNEFPGVFCMEGQQCCANHGTEGCDGHEKRVEDAGT